MRALVRRGAGVAILLVLAAYVGCAHIRPLEGGAPDKTPPELLAMTPADSSRGVGRLPALQMRFSENLHPTSVTSALRTYPAQPRPDVRVRGAQVEIRYRDSLPPDTTLIVVLGRSLQDAPGRDNKLPHELWFVFATGDTLRGGAVLGRITVKGKPEPQAALRFEPVAASAARDTAAPAAGAADTSTTPVQRSTPTRRSRHPAAGTDLEGLFAMLGLPAGVPFVLRAFVDRNANFDIDEGELAAAYPETLRLAPGEVRRGLEWNLVDPREPGQVHGVVFNRTPIAGPIAVALLSLDPDTSAAAPAGRRAGVSVGGGPMGRAPGTDSTRAATRPDGPGVASADSAPATVPPDTLRAAGADSARAPAAADTLPIAPQGSWATAYAALGPVQSGAAWQVVYASPRGDYSIRVRPGRHRLAAFVDVSADSLPGTHVAPDSAQRLWEPLWVGGVLEITPASEVRPRAIDIDTPR